MLRFAELAFNGRQPEAAARKYLGTHYRQHNPSTEDITAAFASSITDSFGDPIVRYEVKRAIAQDDLIVLRPQLVGSDPAVNDNGML